jgi:hypothetical protein
LAWLITGVDLAAPFSGAWYAERAKEGTGPDGVDRLVALEGGPAASPDARGVEPVRVAGASSLAAGRGGGAGHAAVAAVAGVVRGDAGLGRPWLADFGRLLNKMSGPGAPCFGFSDAPSECAHCLSGGHCTQRVCPPVHCLSVSAGGNWSRGSPSLTCPGASDDANSRGRRRACSVLGGQGAVDRELSPPLVIVFLSCELEGPEACVQSATCCIDGGQGAVDRELSPPLVIVFR